MNTKFFKLLSYSFLSIMLFSCAASKITQDSAEVIMEDFAFHKVPPLVHFDPYTAKVYFNRKEIQTVFEDLIRKLEMNGCRARPLKYPDDSYWKLHYDQMESEEWAKELWSQLSTGQGWAISQFTYPKAGLEHGDYSVECCIVLRLDWCGATINNPRYNKSYRFKIKSDAKKVDESSKQKELKEDNNPLKSDNIIAEKLKKLKEMFDNGLITKDEYDQKRKSILEGL